ncbi:hypothetical protein BBJ28_00000158 [Nothophytophthora sp. Chile5]|nr:hypothetical protein BBJ28_00000158 [Nothophytophthora sp. Chile5]
MSGREYRDDRRGGGGGGDRHEGSSSRYGDSGRGRDRDRSRDRNSRDSRRSDRDRPRDRSRDRDRERSSRGDGDAPPRRTEHNDGNRDRERGPAGSSRDDEQQEEEETQPQASGAWDPTQEALNDPTWARIYISNLPTDMTSDELQEMFGALGVVAREKQKRGYKDQWPFKIKVYTDTSGQAKGDAVLTYEDANAARTAPSFFNGAWWERCLNMIAARIAIVGVDTYCTYCEDEVVCSAAVSSSASHLFWTNSIAFVARHSCIRIGQEIRGKTIKVELAGKPEPPVGGWQGGGGGRGGGGGGRRGGRFGGGDRYGGGGGGYSRYGGGGGGDRDFRDRPDRRSRPY